VKGVLPETPTLALANIEKSYDVFIFIAQDAEDAEDT